MVLVVVKYTECLYGNRTLEMWFKFFPQIFLTSKNICLADICIYIYTVVLHEVSEEVSVASLSRLTARLCSSCGLSGQTLYFTSSCGAGPTSCSLRRLMPTRWEKLPAAFVTISWWEHEQFCVVPCVCLSNRWTNQSGSTSSMFAPVVFRRVSYGLGIVVARCSSVPQWTRPCGSIQSQPSRYPDWWSSDTSRFLAFRRS